MARVAWADFRTPPINLWVLPPWRAEEEARPAARPGAAAARGTLAMRQRRLMGLLCRRAREG